MAHSEYVTTKKNQVVVELKVENIEAFNRALTKLEHQYRLTAVALREVREAYEALPDFMKQAFAGFMDTVEEPDEQESQPL